MKKTGFGRAARKWVAAAMSVLLIAAFAAGCAAEASEEATTEASEAAEQTTAVATESESAQAETEQAQEGETITVIDHNGDEVVLPREINRVVSTSMYPLPSVFSFYLGSAEKLVGIDPVSMTAAENSVLSEIFPEILNASTDFMDGDNINLEELMKLDPDVVIYHANNAAEKELLQSAGIPAVGISATNWDYDVIETYDQWIDILGQMFPDQDKSAKVSEYSMEIYDMVQERVADIPDDERVQELPIFTYDESALLVSGNHFFGEYWAEASGGVNVGAVLEDQMSVAIDMEQVYEWDPEVIYITNFTPAVPDDLYTNSIGGDDWSEVSAVKNQRVYKMPMGAYRSFTPGIDTPLTLLWMAKTSYPDLFEDIDLNQEVKDYYSELFGVELSDEQVASMYEASSAAGDITLS